MYGLLSAQKSKFKYDLNELFQPILHLFHDSSCFISNAEQKRLYISYLLKLKHNLSYTILHISCRSVKGSVEKPQKISLKWNIFGL